MSDYWLKIGDFVPFWTTLKVLLIHARDASYSEPSRSPTSTTSHPSHLKHLE